VHGKHFSIGVNVKIAFCHVIWYVHFDLHDVSNAWNFLTSTQLQILGDQLTPLTRPSYSLDLLIDADKFWFEGTKWYLTHIIAVKISIRKLHLHTDLLTCLFAYLLTILYCAWIAELLSDPEVAKHVLHTEDNKECRRLTDGVSEVEWAKSVCSVIRKGNFAKVWTCGTIVTFRQCDWCWGHYWKLFLCSTQNQTFVTLVIF